MASDDKYPLLKIQLPNENISRVDRYSIMVYWTDPDSNERKHELMFYPSEFAFQEIENYKINKTHDTKAITLIRRLDQLITYGNASWRIDVSSPSKNHITKKVKPKRLKLKTKPKRLKLKTQNKMNRLKLKVNISPKDCVLIIDGKYLIYRIQYSRELTGLSYNNVQTGVYYGFFNSLRMMISKFDPINIVIMWDSNSKDSIRKKEFDGYKNRTTKYLKPHQIEILKKISDEYPGFVEFCTDIGLAGYQMKGYEADDLIALYTRRFDYFRKVIITRDEDMYQCLDKTTSMYDPDSKQLKTLNWFESTYQISPKQWNLFKAYAGCKSDTVPGIPGIGEKTALKILHKDEKALIKFDKSDTSNLDLWKQLVTLPHPSLNGASIPFKQSKLNMDKFYAMCHKYNFKSFLSNPSDFSKLS